MVAICWGATEASRTDPPPPEVAELVSASEAALGARGYDAALLSRGGCHLCGESYRMENLSLCVLCPAEYCPPCSFSRIRRYDRENGCCEECGGEVVA